jgi:integrase
VSNYAPDKDARTSQGVRDGVEARAFELRHSAGTLLFAMGVEVKFITEILGHSSDRVTRDIYIHATDEGKAEALNAMSAAIWGA